MPLPSSCLSASLPFPSSSLLLFIHPSALHAFFQSRASFAKITAFFHRLWLLSCSLIWTNTVSFHSAFNKLKWAELINTPRGAFLMGWGGGLGETKRRRWGFREIKRWTLGETDSSKAPRAFSFLIHSQELCYSNGKSVLLRVSLRIMS